MREKQRSTHLKPVISSNNFDAENVFVVVEMLQPLKASGRREPGFDVDLPQASNANTSLHNASANKRLVLLRLIEPPNKRPHLQLHTEGDYHHFEYSK